jgi:hypothetical protein
MPPLVVVDSVNTVLTITSDCDILERIKARYLENEFCKCITAMSMKGWQLINGLWYIGQHLHVTDIHENIFKMAHNCLGHFGLDKSYASLCNCYYWLNMHWDLEQVYIPTCADCLQNKYPTTCPAGPLHPLSIPDHHGSSIAMCYKRNLLFSSGDLICTTHDLSD